MLSKTNPKVPVRDKSLDRSWPTSLADAKDNYPRHFARYSLARQYVWNKDVCDVACGVGYGCWLLSEDANSVLGLDAGTDAIKYAKAHFSASNTEFMEADLNRTWCTEQRFDTIISFETMEHLKKPELFLDQVVSHLKPEGQFILSVPNGPRDYQRQGSEGKHIQFFEKTSLRQLLDSRFQDVEFYSQTYRKNIKHFLQKCLKRTSIRLPENYIFLKGLHDEPATWLGIAKLKRI